MALSFKALSVFLALSTFASNRGTSPKTGPSKALQADVCELLRDQNEELSMRYPNEFYDCTAHSRYFKEASLQASPDRPLPG